MPMTMPPISSNNTETRVKDLFTLVDIAGSQGATEGAASLLRASLKLPEDEALLVHADFHLAWQSAGGRLGVRIVLSSDSCKGSQPT